MPTSTSTTTSATSPCPRPEALTGCERWSSELMSAPMDSRKPLWNMHVIDNYRGGSVILTRVHHCIGDGIALVRVMLSLTDESPTAEPRPASTRRPTPGFRLPLDWLPSAVVR